MILKVLKIISISTSILIIGFFASYGLFRISKNSYSFLSQKIEYVSINTKISFGRDVVVKEGFGGPEAEYIEDLPVTHLNKYVIDETKPLPVVSAKYFLVGDVETGQIIMNKNSDKSVPIASISKLMTSVVADENIGLEKETVVSNTALDTYGRQGSLKRGEVYTIEELLYPLLLESSNDAAEVIAEYDNRFAFMLDMNNKAKLLGMNQTYFEDPSGLSKNNVSSADDLFELVQYIYKYRNYIFEISREKSHKINGKVWYSNSKFRNDVNYLGGKNGYTDEAGKTNLGIFSTTLYQTEERRNIVIIVLNSSNTERDTKNIISYLGKSVRYE